MQKLRNLKHIFVIIVLSLSAVFGSVFLPKEYTNIFNGTFIYRTGEDAWQDRLYTHTLRPSSDIAIIRIDNESLNAMQAKGNLKMLTIPKSYYITLIEKLEAAGVKGIAFDIIFENADKDEELFAKTLEKYNNIVIASEYSDSTTCVKDQTWSYENCSWVPRSVYRNASWGLISMADNAGFERIGSADISGQPYRSWKIGSWKVVTPSDFIIPTLPLAVYLNSQTWKTLHTLLEKQKLILNPYFWPAWIYPSLSFIDAVDMGRLSTIQTFKGKYVFIWESGTAIHDAIDSPVNGKSMDWVEVHANFLDWLKQDKMLENLPQNMYFAMLIALAICMVIVYYFLPGIISLILSLASLIGIVYVSRYAYDIERILLDIIPLFLATFATFLITYIYRFFIVDREKRQLKSNFSHYIDPRVVDQIVAKSDSIELGGEKKNLSVLFSDIAGFTTISETLDPRDLFYLMTSYLSYMTDILIKEWWTLDKYIGDAVMGFFGAPISYEDHAIRSANTAIRMRKALAKFNMEIGERGIESIDFRVGIASGEVMVGNIGSHDRFNYTVLWDTVNLASRLEGTGKEYDVHIIISHATKMALTPHFFTRELDTIAVKWKSEGVRIHELVGYSEEFVDRTKYTLYERALGLYRAGDYREAGKLWQTQVSLDPPSRIMMLRCVDILKGNIEVKNGVYQMLHK
jgi:class 3 adenylate cyclase/CHASE2 domain-containing sensor protein